MGIMIKIFSIIYVLFLWSASLHAAIIADYHFDTCSWDGTSSEVRENTNNYHATAKNGAFTDKGVINFSANLITDNYLQLENNIPVSADYTISAWIKFPLDFSKHTNYSDTYFFTIADRPGSDDDFIYLRFNVDDGWQWKVHDDTGYGENTLPTFSDGWHLLTFTASGDTTTLYIDSVEENSIDKHSEGEISLIGTADYDDDLDGQTLGALLDEFKVFDTNLSLTEIQTIFNNEKKGKDYTGNSRTPTVCSIETTPHAEYYLDSCSWKESTGEVQEHIHDYNGTAYNVQPSNQALILHSADFSADTTTDYLSLDSQAINGLNSFTISTWIKTTSGDYQTIISGAHSGGEAEDANEVLLWLRDSGKIEFFVKGVRSGALTIPDIQDNEWHHIIWSREDKHVILYIDGNKELDAYYDDDATLGALTIDSNGLVMGQDQDSVGGDFDQNFLGNIDELKIFNTIITPTEVQIIYKNDQISRNYDGTVRKIPSCAVVANYRFDSCEWDGTAREVMDQRDLHDASITANDVNLTSGKLNNSASFPNENNITDIHAIDTGITPMDIGNQGSISFWFKSSSDWNGGEGRTLIDATKGDKYFFVSLLSSGKIQFWLEDKNDADLQMTSHDSFSFVANEWVYLTLSWDLANSYKLYINGQEQILDISKDTLTGAAFGGLDYIRIGDIIVDYVSSGRENSANGIFDEVKIFNTTLTDLQIQEIYDNESQHINYDGSHRMAVDCTIPVLLAEYRFDECKYDGSTGEVIDSQGNDNSGTIPNFDTTQISTIQDSTRATGRVVKLDGGAVDIDNLAVSLEKFKKNTVMFWMKWNGDNGVMPFGWNRYDLWFPNDYFGFNSSAGDLYGISSSGLANGWHHVAAVFTNGDMYSNRLYIDGTLQTLSQLKNTSNNYSAVCTTFARIGGWRVTDDYRFKSHLDEFKLYQGEVNATTIASIYNDEVSLVRDIICSQAIFNAVNQSGGCFHWDNNITTKIAGAPIALTILSADENDDNNSLQDVNITKLELLSFSDATCSTLYNTTQVWSGNQEVNSSACFNPAAYTHNKAVKCAKIKITGIYEGKSVEANSSDTFSIRPERFTLTPALDNKLISEHPYTFQVQARNYQSTSQTPDFNQSLTTPTSTLRFREGSANDGSLEGIFSLTPNNLSFNDGLTNEGNLSFDNVGLVTLDINDTTWAEVDSDDTPLADRTIYLEHNLTFIPDHFDIAFTSPIMMNHLEGSFTYLSNDLNMSAWLKNLSARLSAKGEKGGLMSNYETPQTLFYANDIDITTSLTVLNSPIMITAPLSTNNTHLSFINGQADINYSDVRFNYPRDYKIPSEPIMIDGSDANLSIQVTDVIDTNVTGKNSSLFTGDATFYYGKIVSEDIKTGENSVTGKSLVEIYSTTTLTGFERETSRWYINKEDSFSTLLGLIAKESRNISSSTSSHTSMQNLTIANQGKISYDLINTYDDSYKAFYHLDIPNWLWHSRYNDYNASSNCSEHPCFEYIYESENTNTTGIKSGNLGSSSFANDFNTSTKRKAIKLLR